MKRRTFLTGLAATGMVSIAGCGGGTDTPPPRRSEVVRRVDGTDGREVVLVLERDPRLVTRVDGAQRASETSVGVTRAAEDRGATGRAAGGYAAAPAAGMNGRKKLYWGAYADTWYDEHEDKVEEYDVSVDRVGIAYLPSFEEQRPGPRPVEWDETYDVREGEQVSFDPVGDFGVGNEGWFRVGVHLVGEDVNRDFGWEFLDMKVESVNGALEVTRVWKVSPRV